MTTRVPGNPYEAAKGVWNERYHHFLTSKHNWQILAVIALISNVAQAGGMVWLASRSRVVPYIVRVDEVGRSIVLGPVEATTVIDSRLVAWQVQDYVQRVREVTADRTAQKNILEAAYRTTRGAATTFLNEHFRAESPFMVMERRTVTAQVESLLQVSSTTWQVDWREIQHSIDGKTIGDERWTGQFTVELDPPHTADEIISNPLGFYVTRISWSRRL
jgi:type IV secretion system protein VirB5